MSSIPHVSQRRSLVRTAGHFVLILGMCALLGSSARADTLPIGFVSWDVTQPGSFAQFDIVNETGPNSSGDSTFPISVPLRFTDLTLSVQLSDLSVRLFTFSQLTLNPFDGLSFESPAFAIGGANLQPVSASLTGKFAASSVTLYDGTTVNINSSFSNTVAPSSGQKLADGDFGLILAQVNPASPPQPTQPAPPTAVTPEPSTWLLVGSAFVLLYFLKSGAPRTS